MSVSSWFNKMTGMGLRLDNLQSLLEQQLEDLYSAETQLISALPNMAAAASSPELASAFQTHLQETRAQQQRLERAFEMMRVERRPETCQAMEGLIAEGEQIINSDGDADIKDSALIAAAQRVEHYEIAGYGCARSFARRLGLEQVATLLQETLDEEGNADKILTHIAESCVNPVARYV